MPEEKLPPHDIDAEEAVIGSLLLDGESIFKIASFLRPQDFFREKNTWLYEACLSLWQRNEAINQITVAQEISRREKLEAIGGPAYLIHVLSVVPTSLHIEHYAGIVHRLSIMRQLISAAGQIAAIGYESPPDIDDTLNKAEDVLFRLRHGQSPRDFTHIKQVLDRYLEESVPTVNVLTGEPLRQVLTGYSKLDEFLGGLQRSDLIVLGARPSMGKTSLVLGIALNAAKRKNPAGSGEQGATIAIFSLEMARYELVQRFISSETGIDTKRVRLRHFTDEEESRIIESTGRLAELNIYIDDSPQVRPVEMRSKARRLQSERPIDLVIVDYLQLIQGSGRVENRVQEISEITRYLKGLARELDVPVLVVSQLSRAAELRTSHRPQLSDLRESGCLTGDTLIFRADTGQHIRIESLVGQTDIPVHSLDENWQITEKKASKVFCSGEKMVYELKTRSGFSIKATANHPFWKISGWTRLDELKVGDRIATAKELKITSPENGLSKEEVILLAHLLGDGCILPKQPYHYTSADQDNINVVAETATKLFGVKPKIVKQKNWWHVYLTGPYNFTHRKFHPITEWYKSLGIERSHSWEKEIPQKIFLLNSDYLALFLKHLWATDGNISKKVIKNRKQSVAIYYATTSKKLAEAVKYLLLRLGIRSAIREQAKKDYRICYHVHVQGKEHQLKFLKTIGCYGEKGKAVPEFITTLEQIEPNTNLDVWPKETWQYFINPIRQEQGISWRNFTARIDTAYCGTTLFKNGIGTGRMQRIAQCLQSPLLHYMSQANIFWDEITSIKALGTQKVYDLTVPELHNFVANGIIVENSIEQDADIVMFIHREDYYYKTEEDWEKDHPDEPYPAGRADIIIAKHRNGPIGEVNLHFEPRTAEFKDYDTAPASRY